MTPICPHNLEWCDDPECPAHGCRKTGEAPLVACEACGELHEPFGEPPLCRACYDRWERDRLRKARHEEEE